MEEPQVLLYADNNSIEAFKIVVGVGEHGLKGVHPTPCTSNMSLTTTDLSLKGFASIDATMTKHAGFVTRALLAQIVEITTADNIVLVIQCEDAATVYKAICARMPSVDRRARTVNAVLTFFDNSPEVTKAFAARKKEWEVVKVLVEEQERTCVAEGARGLTVATGIMYTTALEEHTKTFPHLVKSGLSTAELKAAIKGAVDVMVDCWADADDPEYAEHGEKSLKPWKGHLELLDLF